MENATLEVRDLVKRFGGLVATDSATLTIQHGEVHGLIGPNGAGKTTLLAQLSGALRSDSGSVRFEGHEVTKEPMHKRVARGIARSHQISNLFKGEFSVIDNVALAVQRHSGTSWSFLKPVAADEEIRQGAEYWLNRCGLGAMADLPTSQLAHGQQRQLEIAIALATGSRMLLLDEPMAGVSAEESKTMTQLISSLKGEVTILLVEHDMDAVFALANQISVLVYGRVIATGTPDQIKSDPAVQRAYLGDEVAA